MQTSTYTIQDVDGNKYKLELSSDYALTYEVTSSGCWSARLSMFPGTSREDWVRLKERPSAAIQYSDPVDKRQSTNTKSRVEAIRWAVDRLFARNNPALPSAATPSQNGVSESIGLTLGQVADLVLKLSLLAVASISPGERRRIRKGLKAVIAGLRKDLDVTRISQNHVDVYYARATGCKPSGAELIDRELRELGLSPGDVGLALDGKPRRSKVKLRSRPDVKGIVTVSTAHNDLCAVRSVLSKLVGRNDPSGTPYLEHNRLMLLDLGRGPGKQTEAVSPERARFILQYADAATELYNQRKRKNESYMTRGGASSVHDNVRQVPVGAVRCIYRIAWQRAVRHEQILGLRVRDHLTTKQAIREAIQDSRPGEEQEAAKPQWAQLWSRHGCMLFLLEFAQKPGYDRVVPNDALLDGEIRRYRELRLEQGLPDEGSLFRYLDHDRPLDANVVREIIRIAEDLARDECVAEGHDPDEVFTERVRPLHDVRTAVINRWDAMGWAFNQNAAWIGCLSTNIKVGNAGDTAYKKLNPHLVMALAEGLPLADALVKTGVAKAAGEEARMEVPF